MDIHGLNLNESKLIISKKIEKLKDKKPINVIDIEGKRIIEKNPYYFYLLFNIIYNDYINYPNYSHFYNIENIFRFMEKEITNKKENEVENKNELNNIFLEIITGKGLHSKNNERVLYPNLLEWLNNSYNFKIKKDDSNGILTIII